MFVSAFPKILHRKVARSDVFLAALCHDVLHDGKILSMTGLLVARVQATRGNKGVQELDQGRSVCTAQLSQDGHHITSLADPGFCTVALAL